MYSIGEFGSMIADEGRTDAYVTALERAITPDSIVLDIGTGTGIFAILACRFGARHVFALEPDDSIHIARKTAQENGCADRITFIQDLSTRITLPERANVMISDLHGILPYFQFHIPSIADARQRLLAEDGIQISRQDTMWATVVTSPKHYADYVDSWNTNKYDLSMKAAHHIVSNGWFRSLASPEDFHVKPQVCSVLDYRTIADPDLSTRLSWTVEKPGIAHGLSVWFDADIADGIRISNAPGQPELVYGQAFFPWTTPVNLSVGDDVQVSLKANLVGDDYVWRWDTRVVDGKDASCVKAEFRQSTFYGNLLSPTQLTKKTATYVAQPSDDAKIDRYILDRMNGERTLGEIANSVTIQFPDKFKDMNDALGRVGRLSQDYSL
jgi:protein arginine N-methyltransferase 1